MERKRDWIRALMDSRFGYCDDHHGLRSNEKNVFCIDCEARLCKHCKEAHSLHRRFQIYKYSYQDVFRYSELQKHFDCSKIQTYISNNERIVHLKPRPATNNKSKHTDLSPESRSKESNVSTRVKSGGATCEECGKHLQDERNCFCSITCKVSVESQSQCHQQHSLRRSSIESLTQSAKREEAIDFTVVNDNQNSEPESSITEAEPYGAVEDQMNFRKRPRKANPLQRTIFVFSY